jgi:poly(3-hydroxybutyrate) depolymerase
MRAVFGLVLIVGIGLAGFAAYMVKTRMDAYEAQLAQARAAQSRMVDTVDVFVADRPLKYGERLSKEDVRPVKWPKSALPEGEDANTPIGAVVFAHGYRGSAAAVMKNKGLRRVLSDMGLALIALKSADDDWVIPFAPRHMDADGSEEFNYVEAVLKDATARFSIDAAARIAQLNHQNQ